MIQWSSSANQKARANASPSAGSNVRENHNQAREASDFLKLVHFVRKWEITDSLNRFNKAKTTRKAFVLLYRKKALELGNLIHSNDYLTLMINVISSFQRATKNVGPSKPQNRHFYCVFPTYPPTISMPLWLMSDGYPLMLPPKSACISCNGLYQLVPSHLSNHSAFLPLNLLGDATLTIWLTVFLAPS